MERIRTEAEIVAFAKEHLLPLIDELEVLKKRTGASVISLWTSGDPDEKTGVETLRVMVKVGDHYDNLEAEYWTCTNRGWTYQFARHDSDEITAGTF